MSVFEFLFGSASTMAASTCMALHTGLIVLHALSDGLIALAFFVIAAGIVWYLRNRMGLVREYRTVALLFVGFILACGVSHALSAITLWHPAYGLDGLAKGVTAALSVAAVALIWPLVPGLVRLPSSQQLADVNDRLRGEAEAHEATLRELEGAGRELEGRVRERERTKELSLVNARFETALHGAKIHVFSQDAGLRYTWMYSPLGEKAAAGMVGRSDEELLPAPEREVAVAAKRRVLATGTAEDCEVSSIVPEQRALYALHIDPTFGVDGKVDGVMCAAIDISRIRSLESEQRRLTEELSTTLQRYETALRGSHVTVHTQDRELRYTSISNAMFGREVREILGRVDQEILPPDSQAPVIALKRLALESGQAQDGEFRVSNDGGARWYDVHIELLRDVEGDIVGLTCASVDITARKAGEAHLRDLMRELTHRSKNLLAVIQGMARQTARHSGTIDSFLEQFSARVQALAASHDLLVQESWYGASLSELVHSQLGHSLDGAQVTMEGPPVLLKPEAAQSLGLAFHELATNAMKHGALSTPAGRVQIKWEAARGGGDGIEILWTESGGPPVAPPQRRGFGSLVIERDLARSLDAVVTLEFLPEGLSCRMVIPAANLAGGC